VLGIRTVSIDIVETRISGKNCAHLMENFEMELGNTRVVGDRCVKCVGNCCCPEVRVL